LRTFDPDGEALRQQKSRATPTLLRVGYGALRVNAVIAELKRGSCPKADLTLGLDG